MVKLAAQREALREEVSLRIAAALSDHKSDIASQVSHQEFAEGEWLGIFLCISYSKEHALTCTSLFRLHNTACVPIRHSLDPVNACIKDHLHRLLVIA